MRHHWAAEAQEPEQWQQLQVLALRPVISRETLDTKGGSHLCNVLGHEVYETSLDDFLYCETNTFYLHVKNCWCGSIKQHQQDGNPSSSTQPMFLNAPQLRQLRGTLWGMDIWRRTTSPQGRNHPYSIPFSPNYKTSPSGLFFTAMSSYPVDISTSREWLWMYITEFSIPDKE